MSNSIWTLLIRNLRDAFGENDPERRRAAIDELYTEDVVFYDGNKGAYQSSTPVNLQVSFQVNAPRLLEFAEARDVPVRWSCRTGVCHLCMTGLVNGSIHYDPEPLERPTPGNVFICCSQPDENVVLDL